MTVSTEYLVGMSDIHVHKGSAKFSCLGLGSCIGLAAFDPTTGVGGMIHMMLPSAFANRPVEKPGKFVDTGMPGFISRLESLGADRQRLMIAYAGGAQVFRGGSAGDSRLDIGARNSQAVIEWLKANSMKVVAFEVGGSTGRTVVFSTDTCEFRIRTVAAGEKVLATLRA